MDPTCKTIRSRWCAREYKTTKQSKIQRAPPASQLFSAMPPLEAVKFVEQKGTIEVETLRHKQSTFPRNSPETHLHQTCPAEDRQKYGEDKDGRLIKRMYGTQDVFHIWQLDEMNFIFGELEASEEANTMHLVPQANPRCENGSARRHLCVFVRR